jgi:hypothetical protein
VLELNSDKFASILKSQSFENLMNKLNLAILIQKMKNDQSEELNKLKTLSYRLIDNYIKSGNITKNDSIIVGDSMFASQIYTSDMDQNLLKEASVKDKFAFLNFEQCEKNLREIYNITNTKNIIFATNNFGSFFNQNKTNTYTFSAFDPDGGILDINYCNNTTHSIEIPITDISSYNLTKYKEMKKFNLDIFNPNDPYLNIRCLSLIDPQTQYDTTVNWRRTNYYQTTIPQCNGLNCTYNGINDNNYVDCSCGIQSDPYYLQTATYVFNTLSTFNIDVVSCPFTIPVYKN